MQLLNKTRYILILAGSILVGNVYSQTPGIQPGLDNLFMLSNAQNRSISPENRTGAKGNGGKATSGNGSVAARELGKGWKVSPSVTIESGQTFTIADIADAGDIRHIWMTPGKDWRLLVLRIYWDEETTPSVELPRGDFFCMGLNKYAPVTSQPIAVNPGSAFNSYWPMPFRKHCRMTIENLNPNPVDLFYQIDYILTDVPKNIGYFHAQFRIANPTTNGIYTLLDSLKGKGQYVGAYMAIGVNNDVWWGEGEIKFYMDGDTDLPTINGTGLEDYFLGSYAFLDPETHQYAAYSTVYSGMPQVLMPNGMDNAKQRFGLYRWHIEDPIYFDSSLKVTIQDLGWKSQHRFLIQHSDIATVSYWYQTQPHNIFPKLPGKDELAGY